MDQRDPHDTRLNRHIEPFHQTRGVHVTVADPDIRARQCLGYEPGRDPRQVEAECRHALADPGIVIYPIDLRATLAKHTSQLE